MALDLQTVSSAEPITRYINERSKIKSSTAQARYNAFMPPSNRRLSVYRTEGIDQHEIWQIADEFVATEKKPVIARADLLASEFASHDLQIAPHPEPHERHANVIGWPEDEGRQRIIALELASTAVLVTRR